MISARVVCQILLAWLNDVRAHAEVGILTLHLLVTMQARYGTSDPNFLSQPIHLELVSWRYGSHLEKLKV
jgi:hypothetical protein